MSTSLRAIQFQNLDEARRVLAEFGGSHSPPDIFDDAGSEPQGLLSVISEDRLPEEIFYRLFEAQKGILVEVERIPYQGFGPPAQEEEYMGFVSENVAYVLQGCLLPIEIENCPNGARDLHHLEAQILDGEHPIDADDLALRLGLSSEWAFEDLFEMIVLGQITAQVIDRMIHEGTGG